MPVLRVALCQLNTVVGDLDGNTGRILEAMGAAFVGFVDAGLDLHNAAAVCAGGEVHGIYRKRLLPNYSVFDEQRYFTPGGDALQLYRIAGVRVGISVCEDVWSPT